MFNQMELIVKNARMFYLLGLGLVICVTELKQLCGCLEPLQI